MGRFSRKAFYALGRLKSGEKNKTEQLYEDEVLAPQLKTDEILWYKFEGVTLKLADNTRYTPDYAVINKDFQLEFHEVKGRWMDDAKVKIKVASEHFPFVFLAVYRKAKKDGGGWRVEEF